MTSAMGSVHDFHSRIEALEFAVREACKVAPWAQGEIRVEGADRTWRSFDCGLKALLDEKSVPGNVHVSG